MVPPVLTKWSRDSNAAVILSIVCWSGTVAHVLLCGHSSHSSVNAPPKYVFIEQSSHFIVI
jgi:hypothetical protein